MSGQEGVYDTSHFHSGSQPPGRLLQGRNGEGSRPTERGSPSHCGLALCDDLILVTAC